MTKTPQRAARQSAYSTVQLQSQPGLPFRLAQATLLVVLTCVAYWPAMHGDFVFDDEVLLTNSRPITASDGLYRIWFTTEPQDYWPITNTSFWIEWRLWGMNSIGYHATNLALHIACSLLLWHVLQRLAIPAPFLAALLFALHPVNVESVAWIAQRKNLLAMLFFLMSIACYLRSGYLTKSQSACGTAPPLRIWYWLSLLAFLLAMLSKGSVAFLPFVLLLLVWWKCGRIAASDCIRVSPFFILAALFSVLNVWFQQHGHKPLMFHHANFLEKLLAAGAIVWFYLGKAIIPVHLLFIYPQWNVVAANPLWWLPLATAVALTIILWIKRKTLIGLPLWVAWCFWCNALLPVMGFIEVGYMQYSLVADHYQHLALIAPVTLVAAAWHYGAQRIPNRWRATAFAAPATAVAALSVLTWFQSGLYASPERLYEVTLQTDPDNLLALSLLGNQQAKAGQLDQAVQSYEHSLRTNPDYPDAHFDLALALLQQAAANKDQALLDSALIHFADAVRLRPDSPDYRNDYAMALGSAGRDEQSLRQLEQGFQLDPLHLGISFNLTNAYAHRQRWDDAFRLAQHALQLAQLEENKEMIRRIKDQLAALRQIMTTPSNAPAETK